MNYTVEGIPAGAAWAYEEWLKIEETGEIVKLEVHDEAD